MASASGNQEIARRYATALFESAQEMNALDAVAADLETLSGVIVQSKDFARLIQSPALGRLVQEKAVLAVAEGIKLSPLTSKFLGLLAQKRRLAALPQIIKAVQREIEKYKGEITAEVTAAEKLSAPQVDAIAGALKKALSLNVKVKVTEDPAIMGGLVIRVGSMLVDSSVRTKLERLTRALKSQEQTSDKNKMKEVA